MPRLRLLDSAVQNLGDIAEYISDQSGSTDVAERFTEKLLGQCEKLAGYASQMGRSRDELVPGIRSFAFKNYVIFFRYLPTAADRRVFEVVAIIEGHRDISAYFKRLRKD